MKDVVVLAGGNSERGLLLRDKLTTEPYCVTLCQSVAEICPTINEERIVGIERCQRGNLGARSISSASFLRSAGSTRWLDPSP